jgi:hypothetical protein
VQGDRISAIPLGFVVRDVETARMTSDTYCPWSATVVAVDPAS